MMKALELELASQSIPFNAVDQQVMCFGHVVNLSSKRVVEYVKDTRNGGDLSPIERTRSVVRAIRVSGMRRDAFESVNENGNQNGWFTQEQEHFVQQVKLQKLELLRDVQTRWDSVYLMLQRLHVMCPVSLHFSLN
jgi:hypothetical protein